MNQEIHPKSNIHTVPDYRYMKIQKEIWSDIERAIAEDEFGYKKVESVNHVTALFDMKAFKVK